VTMLSRGTYGRMPSAPGGASSALAEPEADVLKMDVNGRRRLLRRSLAFSSDARLARRAAGGDPTAFEEIFRRYQQDLYRFCVGILREPQDAQDAVQNTMIRAMRALPGETREMQLKPWLYRIAHNEAVELRRRERPVEPLGPRVDDATAGTEERAEQDERLRILLADIADLPERQRASLVMRELNGLGFGEIGAALGTSPGAVRQALYEARRGLGQMESGRDMDCDAAMKQVSDADGSPSRRGIRAHLRDCITCRRFQAEIRERRETLAAISPMPAIALAAFVKGGLDGSTASGGATAGGSSAVAGGSSVAAGGSSIAAGGAGAGAGGIGAGALGVSGLVKATAGLIAALAVGTVAVGQGGVLTHGQGSGQPDGPAAQARGVEAARIRSQGPASLQIPAGRPTGAAADATGGRSGFGADPEASPAATDRGGTQATAGEEPSSGTAPSGDTPVTPTVAHGGAGGVVEAAQSTGASGAPGIAGVGSGKGDEKSHAEAKQNSKKAEVEAEKNEEAVQPKAEKANSKPERAEEREHPEHPEHPAHPENGEAAPADMTATGSTPAVATPEPTAANEHPEHPEHPDHPAHPEMSSVEAEDITP
jgi:RNA polymerase sigma factor (sigma-70 family)